MDRLLSTSKPVASHPEELSWLEIALVGRFILCDRSGSAVGTAPSSAISSSSVRTTCSESGGTVDGTGAAGSSDPPVAGIWTPQGGAQAREAVVEKLASARGVGHDSEATCRVGSAFHPSPLLRASYRPQTPGSELTDLKISHIWGHPSGLQGSSMVHVRGAAQRAAGLGHVPTTAAPLVDWEGMLCDSRSR